MRAPRRLPRRPPDPGRPPIATDPAPTSHVSERRPPPRPGSAAPATPRGTLRLDTRTEAGRLLLAGLLVLAGAALGRPAGGMPGTARHATPAPGRAVAARQAPAAPARPSLQEGGRGTDRPASPHDELAAARALWEAGERRAALNRLERAVASKPHNPPLRRALAEYALALSRPAAALPHALALGERGRDLAGRALFLLGRYEEALERLDALDPDSLLMRIEALHHLGRAGEERAAIAQALARLGPGHAGLRLARARRLAEDGDLAAAAALWREALSDDPLAAEALFGLGRTLVRLGEREEGLRLLERHRRLLPLFDALEFARRSAELSPNHAPNLAALGDAWRALAPFDPRALERALDHYRRADELATAEECVPIALRRARCLAEDAGRLEAALAVLDRAARRVRDPRPLVRAGDLLAAAGRRDEARARYTAALELAPADPAILRRLAALDRPAEGNRR